MKLRLLLLVGVTVLSNCTCDDEPDSTSNESSVTVDGGVAFVDGGVTFNDGGPVWIDGGVSLIDGGTMASDGGISFVDGGAQVTDGGVQLIDGGVQLIDGGVQLIDGGVQLIDGGAQFIDGGIVVPDGGVSGASEWVQVLGTIGDEQVEVIDTDSLGNIYLLGRFYDSTDLGGGVLTSSGSSDVFLASYTASGQHRWSIGMGGQGQDGAKGMAVDDNGNIYIAGFFNGTFDTGTTRLVSQGLWDIFVISFTSAGNLRWAQSYGSGSYDVALGMALHNDKIYVGGGFSETINFGGNDLTRAGNIGKDCFLLSLTAAGVHRWSRAFGGSQEDAIKGLTTDSNGNVTVTGSVRSSVDFGGGTLPYVQNSDLFIASFTEAGVHRWSRTAGNTNVIEGRAITADDQGNVYLAGNFTDSTNFGGSTFTSSGTADLYLASYDSAGNHRYSRSFTNSGNVGSYNIASNSNGDIFIGGYYTGGVDFGGGVLGAPPSGTMFIVSLDQNGQFRWANDYGGTNSTEVTALALSKTGKLITAAHHAGTGDFGSGLTVSFSGFRIILMATTP